MDAALRYLIIARDYVLAGMLSLTLGALRLLSGRRICG